MKISLQINLLLASLLYLSCAHSAQATGQNHPKVKSEFERNTSNIIRHGSHDEVLNAFSELIELDPGLYFGERAKYFMRTGQPEKAREDYDKAVELNPDMWLSDRAKFEADIGDLEAAAKDYSTLINSRTIRLETKTVNLKNKQTVEALAHVFWRRSCFYEQAQDIPHALDDLQNSAAMDKSFLPNLAEFAKEHGLAQVLEDSLTELIKIKPDYYLIKRAEFFEQQGRFELALKDFNEAVQLSHAFGAKDGYSPRAWAVLARRDFYLHTNELRKAAADDRTANSLERKQRLIFGFSAWPK